MSTYDSTISEAVVTTNKTALVEANFAAEYKAYWETHLPANFSTNFATV